MISETKYGWE